MAKEDRGKTKKKVNKEKNELKTTSSTVSVKSI